MTQAMFWKANAVRFSFYVVAAFTLLCAVTGGSARADEPLLILMRLGGIVALIALILLPAPFQRQVIAPLDLLLAVFAATIAIQLIPLPPAIWTALPGHGRFAEVAPLANMPQPWRPISIVPDLTVNSLMALLPAVIILLGYAKAGPIYRDDFVKLLCVVGIANVLVGILQTVGGPQSPAFYYGHIARGVMSGLFSNRNHFAVYLATVLPMALYLASFPRSRNVDGRLMLAGGFAILLLMSVLASGSRSGTIVFTLCGIAGGAVLWSEFKGIRRSTAVTASALTIIGVAVFVLAYTGNRAASINRFQALSTDEMRIRSLPVVTGMIREFFPLGTGFGTFDAAFRISEPDNMLKPSYFNNAHNDWLEIALTGGLPAVAALLLFGVWFAQAGFRILSGPASGRPARSLGRIGMVIVGGIAIASFTDYPLRTPIFTVLLTTACCLISDATRRRPGGDLLPAT